MLIELCLGYPERLLRAIGHPVMWIGHLIGLLDRWLNRETIGPNGRRTAGVVAVLILFGVVGAIAFVVQHELLHLRFGVLVVGLLASTLIAQRSLHRHVADVAGALEKDGIASGRNAVSHIVGRDTEGLDAAGIDDKVLTHQEAIISSMTKKERADPDLINGSRRRRIAAGAGVEVSEVNKLLKMHRQMSDVLKKMGKGGRMPGVPGMGGGMGGLPPGIFPGRR